MLRLVYYPGAVVVEMPARPCFTDADYDHVKHALYQAGREAPRLVVDCRAVETISGTFLSALLVTMKRLAARPGDIVLCEVPDVVRSVLQLTRLDHFFPMHPTREDALTAAGPEPTPLIVDRC